DTVTLALIAPGRVAGMVVDMAGDPAGKCSVALKGTEDGEGPETIESLFRDVFGQEAAAKTVTDAFGVFEFEEVWPGEYTVKAKSGEGGSGASGTFQVAAGAEKLDLRIVLADGVRVAGVVVDKRGLPVAGALVQLSEAGDADPVRQLVVQVMVPGMRRTSGTAVTDDAGEFRIDGVMPGGYDLTATHRAYAQKIVRGLTVGSTDTARQRVVLSDPSQAEGRFTVKGEPRPGAMVMFFGPSGLHIASTDSEGRFEVNGLSPGAYVAKGFDPAGLALMEGMDFSGVDLSIDVVDVANGEDVDLDLGTGGGTPVQGTLQGVGGDAVTWVVLRRPDMAFPSPVDAGDVSGWIDALRGVGGQGFVAEDGSFDVGEVEPGNYVVEVYSVDFSEGPPEIGNLMGLLEQPMLQQNVEIGSEPVTLTLGVPGATAPEE
ncbi:MAG: carboxypeptidase regulatory-like domain-containing protein, partial [bacterium]|nr:carboxypeptidase regulatory-like domain-containing protein [bacterium]